MTFHLRLLAISSIWLACFVWLTTCHPLVPSYGVVGDLGLGIAARRLSTCFPLELSGLERLEEWDRVKERIRELFGRDPDSYHVNDDEYPNKIAEACMPTDVIPVSYARPPDCKATKNTLVGIVDGTNQTTTFAELVGTIQKTVWTVTRETTLTRGFDVAVTLEFPAITKVETHFQLSGSLRNERQHTFDTTISNIHESRYMFANPDGKKCTFKHETMTCKATAQSQVPIIAQGKLFVKFGKPVTHTGDPDGSKHYHWFLNLEGLLSEEERTSFIEIQGPFSIEQSSASKTVCEEYDEDEEEEEEEEEEEALEP